MLFCERNITDSCLTTHFVPDYQNKSRTKLSKKLKYIFERKNRNGTITGTFGPIQNLTNYS